MAGWKCSGSAKDGNQYPNQYTPGPHEPYENFGSDCVICGLTKEQVLGGGGKAPAKAIAAVATAAIVLALAGLGYLFLKPCPSGQQKDGITCVAAQPSTLPSSSTPTSPSTFPSDPGTTVSPAPDIKSYRTLAEVPVLKVNVMYGGSTSFAPVRPRKEWREKQTTTPERLDEFIAQAHPEFNLIYRDPPFGEKAGSGSGIRMLLTGQLSIAQSSRPLKKDEIAEAEQQRFPLRQVAVAIDGLAIYVNHQLSIPGLTLSQIKDIYTGKITNWKQVGGPDLEIKPFSRDPEDGGTPEFFREEVLGKEGAFALSVQPYVQDTTDSIRKVNDALGGIGYATASEVCPQESIKPLPVAKVDQNFKSPCNGKEVNQIVFGDGSYPIIRQLFVIIKQDGADAQKAGIAYVELALSEEGQQLIEKSGLVPLRPR